MKLRIIECYPLIFSLLDKNISLSTMFSYTLRPCSSVFCYVVATLGLNSH